MKLTMQESYAALDKFGCYVTEACDRCGKLLGPVRYTQKGDTGVWCSRECRGDVRHTVRRGGRPRKYQTIEQAQRAKLNLQRARREAKTRSQSTENKVLANAKIASLVVPLKKICPS